MAEKHNRRSKYASAALFFALSSRNLLNFLPDRAYLSAMWRAYFHRKFDWKSPKSFNEKVQWLKVKDRNPLYPTLVDKYAVRAWVGDQIGAEYLVPLVGGPWNSFDEIDFASLPERFVLKSTHDSGGVVICRSKAAFDKQSAREKLEKSLHHNYYWAGREWPYQFVQPRIIAETYLGSEAGVEPADYKFIMSGSKCICLFVTTNRFSGGKMNMTFFDTDWNRLPFERMYPVDPKTPECPERYDEMIHVAETLAKDLPLVRVDLYEINQRVYFGEMTLYPGSGMETFQPEEWDDKLGAWVDLKKFFPKEFES